MDQFNSLSLTAGQWPMVSPRPFDQKPVSSYHHLLRKCPPLSLRIGVEDNTAESPPGWRRRSTASIAIQNPSHQPTGVYQHPAMSTSQTLHLNNFLFNSHFLVALCILDHVFEDTFYALGRTLIGWSWLKCPNPPPHSHVTIMVTLLTQHHLLGFPITETDSIAFTELVICNEIGTYFHNLARL